MHTRSQAAPPPEQIRIKRGDTVRLGCTVFDEANLPADLSLVEVQAQVRQEAEAADLVAQMRVEWVDRAQGRFELWAPGDSTTAGWPLGNLRIDVQYSQSAGALNIVRSTETFYLLVVRDVTA
jgi:hypothetical protein